MSLSILEIKASPQYQLLASNVDDAQQTVCSTFCDLLSYVASVSCPEKAAIELVFHKANGAQPRLLITFRSDEQGQIVPVTQVVKAISSYLTCSQFIVEELVGEALAKTVGELRDQLTGRIIALTKSEKVVASTVSYAGYYYYTDTFDTASGKKIELTNFNSLLNQLQACTQAMVAFQLVPTQLTQAEYSALSNLSAELASTTQGVFINHQMLREVTAEAPRNTYAYYTERAAQPLFIGNIVLASSSDDLNGLVSALRTSIQTSVHSTIDLTAMEIENSHLLSYDYFHFPWNLYNQLFLNYRDQNIWNGTMYQPTNLIRLPYLFTANEASVFFRAPIDDGKIYGIQSNRAFSDNEILSERVVSEDNIILGKLIHAANTPIGTRASDFTRHALIVGTPGSGKTTFALNLLLQFYKKGIPFLAIEPTKTEYRALIDKIPELQVFTPGNSDVIPFIINPFIPPKGIRLEQYIPSLMSAFRAAFSMESPLDVIFLRAIRQCYAQYGWRNDSKCDDPDVQLFGLFEFVLEFKKIVASSAYKPETKANIETGGTFRLLNLLDQNRHIYDSIHTIPIDVLLQKPTVLELNAIADDEQKALIMALLLISICLYTKNKGSSFGEIHNVLMIDEAHVLLDAPTKNANEQNKAQSSTVKSLQKMIAEIRSFGTGIIIADQVPSKVTSDIVANADLKVSFRLVEQNERGILSNSTNMTDQQSQHLARLKRGEAIVYFSDLESPKVIITPDVRAENDIRFHISDEEIKDRVRFWDSYQKLLMPYHECSACQQCTSCGRCDVMARQKAEYYSAHIISAIGSNVKDQDTLIKYMYRLHELVINYESQAAHRTSLKLICNCTKIHFIRNILEGSSFSLSRGKIMDMLKQTLIKEGNKNV